MTQPYSQSPSTSAPVCYAHPDRPAYVLCQRCNRPICGPCMTQAPVGYQCPACVHEGNRGMRRVRQASGLERSARENATTVTLIAINVLVWLAILFTGWNRSPLAVLLSLHREDMCALGGGQYAVTSAATCQGYGGTFSPGVLSGGAWELLTSVFTHVQFLHIAFNMLALWVLGPALERYFGRWRFLLVYLGSGLIGSVLVTFLSSPRSMSLGASGAIFGLMAALLLVAVKHHGDVRGILTWIGINALFTVLGGAGISWQAHLGGFLGGLLITALLLYAPRPQRR